MVHQEPGVGLKRYPLISSAGWEEGWQVPIWYGLNRASSALSSQITHRRNHPLKIIVGGVLDAAKEWTKQKYKTEISEGFPKLGVWRGYAEGAANVADLYTVELEGHELPVYVTKREGRQGPDIPTNEQLTANIQTVVRERKSHYNTDELISFYNGDFDIYESSRKYTREDYNRNLIDPNKFKKWLVRDDLWNIQQFSDLVETRVITVDGTRRTIRHYCRPETHKTLLQSWLYWAVGDKVYDLIDAPFDPIQRQANKMLSHAAQQELTELEYKRSITPLIRTIFRSGRTPLAFDLAGAQQEEGGHGDDHAAGGGGHGHYGYRALQELYEEGVGRN